MRSRRAGKRGARRGLGDICGGCGFVHLDVGLRVRREYDGMVLRGRWISIWRLGSSMSSIHCVKRGLLLVAMKDRIGSNFLLCYLWPPRVAESRQAGARVRGHRRVETGCGHPIMRRTRGGFNGMCVLVTSNTRRRLVPNSGVHLPFTLKIIGLVQERHNGENASGSCSRVVWGMSGRELN